MTLQMGIEPALGHCRSPLTGHLLAACLPLRLGGGGPPRPIEPLVLARMAY